MMITTSPATAPTHGPDLESFLPARRESPLRGLAGRLLAATRAAGQNLGHLEEALLRAGHELFRQRLETAAQEKAAAAPPRCPHGQHKLRRLTDGHGTTVQTRWGPRRRHPGPGRWHRA